ncbi:MAG: sigma-70 family RNA polymerase sigma factor [Verrucomicrobiales bacterium]|nr:sigma-70 family RNA polymerase sigma factor [Verrucomicrobiales bacterium]
MPSPKDAEEPPAQEGVAPGVFVTTHWSVVLAAGRPDSPQSARALEILCRQYWQPVYRFVLRHGHGPDESQDLTQEFFARLLERQSIETADASRGRFRTFLLTAVTRFLINQRERARAQKRGGGATGFSFDDVEAENQIHGQKAVMDTLTPEAIYERRWAEALLETVLARLRLEYEWAGEAKRFEILKPFLMNERRAHSGARLAAQLGVAESSAYSAVSRFRKRYGEFLREEIARTVQRPEDVEDELRHLLRILTG